MVGCVDEGDFVVGGSVESFAVAGNSSAMAWLTHSSATGGGLSRKMWISTWL